MNYKEAAKFLELNPLTLRNYRQAGIGPKCKLKRVWTERMIKTFVDYYDYTEEDLIEWARTHKFRANKHKERFNK